MRLLLTLLVLIAVAPSLSAQPGDIYGYFTESSTGPYAVDDVFEVTLWLYAGSATDVTMGVSSFVLDYNRNAMAFPSDSDPDPTGGPSGDFEWLHFNGVGTGVTGATTIYSGSITPNNVFNNRLTLLTNLATFPENQDGELLPSTPTPVVKIRFTVVDPEGSFTLTPKSQQYFDGLGGLGGRDGAYTTGGIDGYSLRQQNVAGNAGWRLLSSPVATPTAPLNPQSLVGVGSLAAQNLVQGVPGYFPEAGSNIFFGYDGTGPGGGSAVGYGAPGAGGVPTDLAPGVGAFWYMYDQNISTGGTSNSVALPFDLTMSGATELSITGDNSQISPTVVSVPLHSAGDGWNLVGNPAGFAIDVAQIAAGGGAFTSSVLQLWDPNAGAMGSYILSDDISIGGVIPPGTGFFLQNNNATTMDVSTFGPPLSTVTPQEGDSDGVQRVAASPQLAFSLSGITESGDEVVDRAAILTLAPGAVEGWDRNDAEKLVPLSTSYATFAFIGERDGDEVMKAQESRPAGEEFSVPMAFDAVGVNGSFTLNWTPWDLNPDLILALVDHVTGEIIDMRQQSSYQFTAGPSAPARAAFGPPSTVSFGRFAPGSVAARFELSVGRFPVAGASAAQGAPEVLALAPASPNPFSGSTRIRFELPEANDVTLAVYDVLGRQVDLLASGDRPAGRHEVALNGSSLANGVYVLRLTVGDQALTQRITVSR